MPLKVAFDTVDFLINNIKEEPNQKAHITFFGGEPLLRWDDLIVPTILYAETTYPNLFTFSCTTNCTLLTKDKIDFMK